MSTRTGGHGTPAMRRSRKIAAVVVAVLVVVAAGLYLFLPRTSSPARTTTLGLDCIESTPPACAHAYLRYADLSGRELSGGNFTGADLRNVNLQQADLENATLMGANIANTDFSNADLTGANLNGTQYQTAIFCNTVMPDGSVNFEDCSQ